MSRDVKNQYVYRGQRLSTTDTLVYSFQGVDEHDVPREDASFTFKKSPVRFPAIGTVYEITESDGGKTVYTGGEKAPVRLRRISDESQIIAWEAHEADSKRSHAEIQFAKREKDISLIREIVLPLRVAMARQSTFGIRTAMANAVLQELHRPLTKAERQEAGL